MPAGQYSFVIEQGATFAKTFTVKQADGSPMNLTGYKIRMMARASYDDAEPTISLSTVEAPGGITITDALAGQFQLNMDAEQTAELEFSKILYDLEIESQGGQVTRLLEGNITLIQEVTK